MKGAILVLLHDDQSSIENSLLRKLEAYRLDEDDVESIRRRHWDYWIYPEEGSFFDQLLRSRYPDEPEELLENAALVRHLPEEPNVSGIIDLDGRWLDLQDFGWRLVDGVNEKNTKALALWSASLEEILHSSQDSIGVRVVVHS